MKWKSFLWHCLLIDEIIKFLQSFYWNEWFDDSKQNDVEVIQFGMQKKAIQERNLFRSIGKYISHTHMHEAWSPKRNWYLLYLLFLSPFDQWMDWKEAFFVALLKLSCYYIKLESHMGTEPKTKLSTHHLLVLIENQSVILSNHSYFIPSPSSLLIIRIK